MNSNKISLVNQVLAIIIQNKPFDSQTLSPKHQWSIDIVSSVLRSIPRFLFQSPRSIGRQRSSRHRPPLKQRNLVREKEKVCKGMLVLGPNAYRDPYKLELGLDKAVEFFYWVEESHGFVHNEMTCREMAIVLARGNRLGPLWEFLKEMARREGKGLVTTATVTCLMKVLGEEGFVNEALSAFYRMRQFRCKPDVYAYNTIIYALGRVGNFKKMRFLLAQMELPGFRYPPDTYTYTIMIASYCKYSLQTGCKKAIRRRLWEANHLFRIMLFKGFVPDVVTYNCLIDTCCKTNRIDRALELFNGMHKRGVNPNRVTYNSFIRYYSAVNEIDKGIEMLRKMEKLEHGLASSSSYTPIIHALVEVGRVVEACDFLGELVERGSIPREYTYSIVRNAVGSAGEEGLLGDEFRKKIEDGIYDRYKQMMRVKPIMSRDIRVRGEGYCSFS